MKRHVIRIVAVVLFIVLLFGLQRLVTPKYMDDILEGSFIEEYYDETTNHDVIMVGDCEIYENFSPITLWEEYGITSYLRGSAQQLIWQSYYMMEESIKREKPKVCVFNVLSMKYNEPQQEGYNRMNLDGMKWSSSKYNAIKASMLPEENMLDYVFPLLRFHSRITQLTESDFTYYLNKKKVTHNGYYMRVDTLPVGEVEWEDETPEDYTFGDNTWYYLDRMRELCEENGTQLVLIKAPSVSPVWYDEYEEQIENYAKEYNLPYINYLELIEEADIDYNTDTYDAGLHMNLSGAEKLAKHLGKYLVENFDLPDRRNEEKFSKVWEEKVAFYYDMKAAQEEELETYGYLKNFGGDGGDIEVDASEETEMDDGEEVEVDEEDWMPIE